MSFWILAGLMTALAVAFLVHPLMKRSVNNSKPQSRLGWILTIVVTILALGLYLALGNPDSLG